MAVIALFMFLYSSKALERTGSSLPWLSLRSSLNRLSSENSRFPPWMLESVMVLMISLFASMSQKGRDVFRSRFSMDLKERFSLMHLRTANRYLPGTVSASRRLRMNESGMLYSLPFLSRRGLRASICGVEIRMSCMGTPDCFNSSSF